MDAPAGGAPAAVCLCDLEFAVYAGAALSLVPAGVARDSLKVRRIPENLLENTREVLNVCVSLFHGAGPARLSLRGATAMPGFLAPDVLALIGAPAWQAGFDITIPGYGAGKATFSGR